MATTTLQTLAKQLSGQTKRQTLIPGKASFGPTPQVPAPPAPPKPVTPTPAAVPPVVPTSQPAAPAPSFDAYYQSDPRFLAQNPIFEAQKAAINTHYGFGQSAAENPYSVVSLLARDLAGASAGVTNTANSRGLLFSGYNQVGQQHALDQYNQQLNAAAQQRDSELLGVRTQLADLLAGIYPDYAAQAGTLGAQAPPDPVIRQQQQNQTNNAMNRIHQSQAGTNSIDAVRAILSWQDVDQATLQAAQAEIARREAKQKKGAK